DSKKLHADPSAAELVKRLLREQAAPLWKRYLATGALMLIAAGATGLGAFLIKYVINSAYVERNLEGIFFFGVVTSSLFMVKALATYFSQVELAKIGNRIVAENQRRMFRRVIRQNLTFFSERHSTDFLQRMTTGANAANQALS